MTIDVAVRGRTYTAVLTPDPVVGGFTVEVPECPGVVTEGDSLEEAQAMAVDAIALWLDASQRLPHL